jgi:hypothetical protein
MIRIPKLDQYLDPGQTQSQIECRLMWIKIRNAALHYALHNAPSLVTDKKVPDQLPEVVLHNHNDTIA